MKNIYLLAVSLCMIMLISACSKEEEELTSLDLFSPTRFDFPQGDNPWDDKIVEIQQEFGVSLIYKDFSDKDLNKNWTSASGAIYYGNNLNDEQAEFYVNFLKDHVFKYVNKDIFKQIKAQYYYLVDSLHNTIGTFIVPHEIKTDGLDFWAICFLPEHIESFKNNDETFIKRRRNNAIYPIIEKAVERGVIEEPANFKKGIDYSTALKYRDYDSDNENYFLRRGFVNKVYTDFSRYTYNSSISRLSGEYEDYLQYIRIAMFLTKEDFKTLYPESEYPLVNSRYEMVVDHIKTNYNIDLQNISAGL